MGYIIPIILFAFLICEETFVREYTYRSSPYDSQISSRDKALDQVTQLLLREVGVYIESNSKWLKEENNKGLIDDWKENISSITAGITKTKIVDEKWDGYDFWVKAEIALDPDDVNKRIELIIKDKNKLKNIKEKQIEKNNFDKKVEELRIEIQNVSNSYEDLSELELMVAQFDDRMEKENKKLKYLKRGMRRKDIVEILGIPNLDDYYLARKYERFGEQGGTMQTYKYGDYKLFILDGIYLGRKEF